MNYQSISGTKAVTQMRAIKALPKETFGLVFITNARAKGDKCGEVRKYENCRLRTAENREGLEVQSEHYLYFTDMDTNEPRMCWKKLIRKVRFGSEWLKINWFE
jgi:hypothetical protein